MFIHFIIMALIISSNFGFAKSERNQFMISDEEVCNSYFQEYTGGAEGKLLVDFSKIISPTYKETSNEIAKLQQKQKEVAYGVANCIMTIINKVPGCGKNDEPANNNASVKVKTKDDEIYICTNSSSIVLYQSDDFPNKQISYEGSTIALKRLHSYEDFPKSNEYYILGTEDNITIYKSNKTVGLISGTESDGKLLFPITKWMTKYNVTTEKGGCFIPRTDSDNNFLGYRYIVPMGTSPIIKKK